MACVKKLCMAIPQDITIYILYHLPAKSLGRFRSVSKEWLSLLSEPQFIKTHEKTLNRNHLICWNGSYISVPFDNHEEVSTLTKFPCESRDIEIEGSCNGLVLASHLHDDVCNFFVLNLTTRDYVEFPVWRHEFSNDLGECGIIGFGYDYVKDDYKVVTISLYDHLPLDGIIDETYYVHIYSLRNNSWKQVSDSPYDHSKSMGVATDWLSGVYANGFPHWIANKGFDRIPVIVAFSLADERFSEVPTPNWKNDVLSHSDSKLVALGDKLAIIDSLECVVWLMNEYGVKESWKKIVVCGFENSPWIQPGILYDNGKLVGVTHNTLMIIYDLKEQTFCKSAEIDKFNLSRVECAYVESLISPKLG